MFKSRKKEKLVSIILPTYNCAKTISKTLDSLINQTYKNIEIICINDGSKDSTFSILYDYKKTDKRIKIYNNKNNMGIAYTRNRGIDLAHGEYIMWCDADDWYEPNMVEEMIIPMEIEYIDFAICETNIVHDENLAKRLLLENFKYIVQLPENELQYVYPQTFFDMSCVLWNKIFRKSIIDKYNIKCMNTKYAEDENFLFKYLAVSKHYYCIHKKLYNYLRNETGITGTRLANKSNDTLSAIKDIENFIHKYKFENYFNIIENIYNNKKEYYATILEKSTNLELIELENIVKKFNTLKDINIFYTIDDNYIEPLIISITSAVKNANKDEILHFHIIYKELKNLKTLKETLSFKNHTVEFIQLSKNQTTKLGNFKNDVYAYKYFIPEIAKNLDKAIYLDADTIILSSLNKLYNTKLFKSYVAVVEHAISPTKKGKIVNTLNIPNYFDCGVILMNLKDMREDDLSNKFIYALKNIYKYVQNPKLDIMNLIINNSLIMLNPQYNLQTAVFENAKPFWCYAPEEVSFAKNNPVIIHYSGKFKPWNSISPHPMKNIYFEYLKNSSKKHLCYWKNK